MEKLRVLGLWFVVCGIFAAFSSAALSESAPNSNIPPVPSRSPYPSIVRPLETRVGADQPMRPMTVEGEFRISLDRLRRELYRYPDQDLVGRFFELLTERPPLFGNDHSNPDVVR